jgi:hypothetical protein
MQHLYNDQIIQVQKTDVQAMLQGIGAAQTLVLYLAEPGQTPDQRALLPKIVSAAGLSLEQDTFHLQMPLDLQISLAQVCKMNQIKRVFVFGLPLPNLGLKATLIKNQWTTFLDFKILYTDSLSQLDQSKDLKLALWSGLKEV